MSVTWNHPNNVSIQNLNENLAFYVETFSFSKSSLHWNLGFHGLMVVMRAWLVIISAVNFTLIVNFFRYFSLFPDYLLYQNGKLIRWSKTKLKWRRCWDLQYFGWNFRIQTNGHLVIHLGGKVEGLRRIDDLLQYIFWNNESEDG